MKLSKCCHSKVKINNPNPQRGDTVYYICESCGMPCDTIEPKEEKEEVKDGACSFCGNNTFYQKEKGTKGDWYCDNCNTFKCTNEQFEKSALKEMIKTPTPKDWIEEKMKEFRKQFPEIGTMEQEFGGTESPIFVECEDEAVDFLKSSLTQQKEAIEKEHSEQLNKYRTGLLDELEELGYNKDAIKKREEEIYKDLLKVADEGEYEDLRREVERYFNNY